MENIKKKILIVTAFPTYGAGSGVLITTQAKSYIEDGHEVAIITGNNRTDFRKLDKVKYHLVPFTAEHENPEKIEDQCQFNYLMFTTHTESTTNFWNVGLEQIEEYSEAFKKAIKEEIETFNPDIVHTQHNWITSSIATEFRKPIALTIHGTDLMGYKKARESLEEINSQIQNKKFSLHKLNDDRQLKNMEELEKIYQSYDTKKKVFQDIKKAIDEKRIDTNKEELKQLLDLYDKQTLYKLYIEHAENSARKSQQIIVISEEQRKEFTQLFPNDKEKVVLLENGYDPEIFHVEKNIKREEVIPKDEQDYDYLALFVGKFADFKGIDALLNGAKKYEDSMEKKGKKILTLIVGSGVLDEKLRKQAKTLNLKHTYFTGRKKQDEISKLQNLSDVSLIPSRNEPFGLVVIEGTACGHPVIATNAGGIPGILNVENKNMDFMDQTYTTPLGVLVPPLPERPHQLAETEKDKLDELITRFNLTNENKENFIKEASKELNIDKNIVTKYLDLYMNTVNSISKSVQDVVEHKNEFNRDYIADYTKQTYSQNVIRDKLINIFNESIKSYAKTRKKEEH